LSSVGKPLLLIPSPNVTANHQYHNAVALQKKGAALVIEEDKLEEDFERVFKNLVTEPLRFNKKCLKGTQSSC